MRIEKLYAVKTLVTHADCPDGLVSAMLVQDAFRTLRGEELELKFVQHETEEHKSLTAEPGMLFADFAPRPERLREFLDAGALVLDHHTTAKEVVEAFGEDGVFGDELAHPGVCGATLVYRHVWLPLTASGAPAQAAKQPFVERLATLAGIRDTWQRHDPRWREACLQQQVLTFVPRARWLGARLSELASTWDRDYASLGELLLEKQEQATRQALTDAHRFTTPRGTRVVVFEGLGPSDAAEALGDAADLVIGFGFRVERGVPKMMLSTRSHTSFDCAALCKAHGGGGHTRAAGLTLDLSADALGPYALAERLVKEWEGRAK